MDFKIRLVFFNFFLPETEFVIRFRKVWNGSRNPFHKFPCFFMKRIPFHTFLKRITNSVSQIFIFFSETEFVIRFRKVWNGSQNPFHKFSCFFLWNGFWDPFHTFLKRITNSVSQILNIFFQKRNSWSVSEKYETDPKICFINFHVFLWNGFRDPFHTFLKRITNFVSEIFKFEFR